MAGKTEDKLTPEQVANWRKVLLVMFGPVAYVLTNEEIQMFRDRMQAKAEQARTDALNG